MFEIIFSAVLFLGTAALMVGIGIHALRAKMPVGFYSGELPPKETDLTDVRAWNRKHGIMWILYGVGIVLGWLVGLFIGDSLWCLLPYTLTLLFPLPFLILWHHKLVARYRVRSQK